MFTLANGEIELSKLISSLDGNGDMNEAQTRFHIIDQILIECLGWNKDDIEVEKADRQKFTDYELGKPRLAILEAKREGRVFTIPVGISSKLILDLPSILMMSSEAKEAIEQAQEYCSKRGVPIAIVSNGHQFIAFLASRQDGLSVFEGNALVFTSLEHFRANFSLAWQLLSVDGIKEKNLIRYLSSGETGIPNKLSSKLVNYPKIRYASQIQATLKQLSELFIQDLVENEAVEEKFFHECYCESGALSRYALLSKQILEARYASLFSDSEPHPTALPVKQKKMDNFSPDVLAESIAHRPIVLLGDVGVGKTSFVKNLIFNSAYEEFKNAIYIYIDLGSKAALATEMKSFVLNEIERQLYDKYGLDIHEFGFIKGVYASDIHRFSKGIWGSKKDSNPDLYEQKLFEMLEDITKEKDHHINMSIDYHSKTSNKQIILSLDNADQRDFDTQQSAFIIAQEIAKEWNSTVFVSVRPQTFFKSKRSGALTAYPHKIFTISPPRIDSVIEKRLLFALSMAEGNIPIETMEYLRINADSLAQFIKALLNSLSDNPQLHEFLDNITGGNIRSGIEFITNFIGSPNIDAEKIIDIMNNTGKYRIPLHEFTKTALLGDYSHFNPDTSIAINVYDVSSSDSSEHFLIPILLSFLDMQGEHRDNDGFCDTERLFEELQNHGYTTPQIEFALRRSTNKKLIETSQRITFEEDSNGELIGSMPTSFRVTSIGVYHLRRWLGTFTYFDAMLFDTPIFDSEYREEISKNLNSLSIIDRYERAVVFKEYLLKCWLSYSQKPVYFDYMETVSDGDQTFDLVGGVVSNLQKSKT